jgi:NADH-ubiquinone oxidoreductase chain 5
LLAFPTIFIGFLVKDMLVGVGSDFWLNSIFVHPKNLIIFEAETIPLFFKLLPVFFSLLGAYTAFSYYSDKYNFLYRLKISYVGKVFYFFFNRKWFFDKVYNEFFVQNFLFFSYFISYKLVDRGLVEVLGPLGISSFVFQNISKTLKHLQTGSIFQYVLFLFSGFFIIIVIVNFSSNSWNSPTEVFILIFALWLIPRERFALSQH